MIQMAENRGLFGDTTQSKSKSSKSKKKVVAEPIKKQKKRSKTLEVSDDSDLMGTEMVISLLFLD